MRQIVLTLTFIFSTLATIGQGFRERHPDLELFIKEVNAKIATCKQVSVKNEELVEQMTDRGGELTGYFSDELIQKMELSVGLSYGVNEFEFFYKESKLFLVNETFRQFKYDEETGSFDYSKTEQTFSGGYLFVKPFDYVTLGHNRFENDELDPEKILREEALEYLTILKAKNGR